MLSIQSCLTLGRSTGQAVSPRLLISPCFCELFCALVGVSYDGLQPPLVTRFPQSYKGRIEI